MAVDRCAGCGTGVVGRNFPLRTCKDAGFGNEDILEGRGGEFIVGVALVTFIAGVSIVASAGAISMGCVGSYNFV